MSGQNQNDASLAEMGEKNPAMHIESKDGDSNEDQIQKMPKVEKVDEFGAHTKTDPKEIALVRKLDWFMLVSLLHSLLKGIRQPRQAHLMVDVFLQLPRPQCHGQCSPQHA